MNEKLTDAELEIIKAIVRRGNLLDVSARKLISHIDAQAAEIERLKGREKVWRELYDAGIAYHGTKEWEPSRQQAAVRYDAAENAIYDMLAADESTTPTPPTP